MAAKKRPKKSQPLSPRAKRAKRAQRQEAARKGWEKRRARERETEYNRLAKGHARRFEHDTGYRNEFNWGMAAWLNNAKHINKMEMGFRILELKAQQTSGDGAIELLQRLAHAEDIGSFEDEAGAIAEEYQMEVRDVYTLWHSPRHFVPEVD